MSFEQYSTIFTLLSFEVLILEMMILMLQVGTFCSRSATTPTLSLNSPVRGSEAQVIVVVVVVVVVVDRPQLQH